MDIILFASYLNKVEKYFKQEKQNEDDLWVNQSSPIHRNIQPFQKKTD